jgi:exopolysaccharide biosynthesis protein
MNRRPCYPLLAIVLLTAFARAEMPERPYPAVVYKYERRSAPVPQKIHVVGIDLTNPYVKVKVSPGGADPDGDGPWQTTLMPPTKIADREGFDVVINGDFFSAFNTKDAEGAAAQKQFTGGRPASVTGPAVTDGKLWGPSNKKRAAFLIDANKQVACAKLQDPPADAQQVVAGSDILVKDGKNVAPEPTPGFSKGPHPRTAVGIADGGKTLLLVVIDGRKKGEAVGMSLRETADVMLKYGATEAVNLDGGGSSMIAIRDPKSGELKILNQPSDGRERSVANVLGVTVKATPPQRN